MIGCFRAATVVLALGGLMLAGCSDGSQQAAIDEAVAAALASTAASASAAAEADRLLAEEEAAEALRAAVAAKLRADARAAEAQRLVEEQAAAAAARNREQYLTCTASDYGGSWELSCDDKFCVTIGCLRSDGVRVGGTWRPQPTLTAPPDSESICYETCTTSGCVQYQNFYC